MKKALVTGISKGIGRAICEQLVKDGYFIVGTYNTSRKEALQIQKKLKNIELHQVNFADRKQTKKLLKVIKKHKFDAIINNAGIIDFENWDEFSMELWDKTMEVNVNTPMLICHTLRQNIIDGGSIVNITSTDGMIGSFSTIAYSASKAALINLTKSLTCVFADKKVRVNSISPGWVGDGMDTPAIADAKWLNPLGRTADYSEIAQCVSFLISPKSSFVNGENMVVDGGSSAVDYVMKKESEAI